MSTNTAISSNERKHTSGNPLKQFALQRFFERLSTLLPTDAQTVLDAGCGEGFGIEELLRVRSSLAIVGCDLSFTAAQYAHQRHQHLHVLNADVTRLPFANRSFDLVTSMEVLEHLPNPAAAIHEYKRLTRRYLLLSVPNEPMFRGLRLITGHDIKALGDHPEHIQHWGLAGFRAFLEAQGLQVVQAASPPPFVWSIVLCTVN